MMTHIMERYFTNTTHVDLTDRLCEAALRSIIANGEKTLKEPENYDTRAEIVWAGTLAHNGLLNTGRVQDWASHRIALEMSGLYDLYKITYWNRIPISCLIGHFFKRICR